LLKDLRRNFTQSGKLLFGFGQVVKLLNFTWKFPFRREDIFFFKGASIYQALATITPILYLSKCIVVRTSTDVHPLNECLLLSGVWIDSVAVCNCQHSIIVGDLLITGQALTVNLRDIESLKLTWGSPCIPRQIRDYGVGLIAPPDPLKR
jgi:hypothetical protein